MDKLYQNSQIRIRPYNENDVKGMFACIRDSKTEMKPYLPWVHDKFSIFDAMRWIEWAQLNWQVGNQYDLVIEDIANEQFLGGVGLLKVNRQDKTAELGYWLRTDASGKGITTQACQLIMQFAKESIGLEKLIIYMSVDNTASIKVAEKLGAKFLEIKPEYEIIQDKALDCRFYELVL